MESKVIFPLKQKIPNTTYNTSYNNTLRLLPTKRKKTPNSKTHCQNPHHHTFLEERDTQRRREQERWRAVVESIHRGREREREEEGGGMRTVGSLLWPLPPCSLGLRHHSRLSPSLFFPKSNRFILSVACSSYPPDDLTNSSRRRRTSRPFDDSKVCHESPNLNYLPTLFVSLLSFSISGSLHVFFDFLP